MEDGDFRLRRGRRRWPGLEGVGATWVDLGVPLTRLAWLVALGRDRDGQAFRVGWLVGQGRSRPPDRALQPAGLFW